MSTRSVRQRLAAVYATLPTVDCAGLCAYSCTTFPVPRAEAREILRRTRVEIGLSPQRRTPTESCPLLTDDRRCGAYDIRPLICRLWGITTGMICSHGCQPTRLLDLRETYALMADVYEIGGQHRDAQRFRWACTRGGLDRFAPVINAAARGDISAAQVERIITEMLHQT